MTSRARHREASGLVGRYAPPVRSPVVPAVPANGARIIAGDSLARSGEMARVDAYASRFS